MEMGYSAEEKAGKSGNMRETDEQIDEVINRERKREGEVEKGWV